MCLGRTSQTLEHESVSLIIPQTSLVTVYSRVPDISKGQRLPLYLRFRFPAVNCSLKILMEISRNKQLLSFKSHAHSEKQNLARPTGDVDLPLSSCTCSTPDTLRPCTTLAPSTLLQLSTTGYHESLNMPRSSQNGMHREDVCGNKHSPRGARLGLSGCRHR